jgi:hypothetical protein
VVCVCVCERERERERGRGWKKWGLREGGRVWFGFWSERDWRERRIEDGGLAAGLSYSSSALM